MIHTHCSGGKLYKVHIGGDGDRTGFLPERVGVGGGVRGGAAILCQLSPLCMEINKHWKLAGCDHVIEITVRLFC